jgi:glycosyltransferase involved in cell wall biosynthesis
MSEESESPIVGLLASYPLQPNLQAVLYNLGRMLKGEVTFDLVMGPEKLPEQLEGLVRDIHVDPPPVSLHGLGFPLKAAFSYASGGRADVLMNVGQPYPLGVAVVTAGKTFGIRTVLRVTGDYLSESDIAKTYRKRVWRQLFHETLLHKIYRQADTVVPVGEQLAQKLVRRGFDEEKVVTIPQPFDATLFEKKSNSQKIDKKRELGLEPDKKMILNVGRLTWGKGADRVLEIARRVNHRASNKFQFCLVGDGPYKDSFSSFPTQVVHTAGYVDREDVHKYFQAADLLIHPTRRDALPNVILEAKAAGVPIVASPVGEIADYVDTTTEVTDEYVQYIINEEWVCTELPSWFEWGYQREEYKSLLARES